MGYIYCITNLINNKRYVGKTTISIEERFKQHCRDSKKERYEKRPLYDAMNKYGIENFIIEELEQVKDEELLSKQEIYWIKELETYGSKGYNATKGGDGKILYDYNEIIELYNLGYNCSEVGNLVGCDRTTISKILKSKGIKIREVTNKGKVHNIKLIDQFDKAGNFIQTFVGSLEAAEWCVENGLSKSVHSASNHIIDCCNNKSKSSMNYKWIYKEIPN